MARFSLIPRDEEFYSRFVEVTAVLTKAAGLLEEMLASDPPAWDKADELRQLEHHCDQLTHDIYQRLHRSFVTPIDREDIHEIAGSLDDVMDSIEATASYVRLYHIEKVRPGARDLAGIVSRTTAALRLALEGLASGQSVAEHVVEVNRLENEGDRVHNEAVRRLFETESDPFAVMKWKEILDYLEDTTDRCEDVADVLGGILLKNE